jgi:hypothetical protein
LEAVSQKLQNAGELLVVETSISLAEEVAMTSDYRAWRYDGTVVFGFKNKFPFLTEKVVVWGVCGLQDLRLTDGTLVKANGMSLRNDIWDRLPNARFDKHGGRMWIEE